MGLLYMVGTTTVTSRVWVQNCRELAQDKAVPWYVIIRWTSVTRDVSLKDGKRAVRVEVVGCMWH